MCNRQLPAGPHPWRLLMSSGPMYSGVPMRMVSMLALDCQDLAKPKSHSLMRGGSLESSNVLSSFRSLCATWFLWQNSTAAAGRAQRLMLQRAAAL
jgi:hypothetical protein